MSVLPIHFHPDAVLRKKCETVTEITTDILTLLDDMVETMYDEDGIGLAAPQVNVPKRLIVVDVEQREKGEPGTPIKLINPEVIMKSDNLTVLDEGCLSLPDMRVEVARPDSVTVRYMGINGATQEIHATDLLAKCLQHEIDHLNGVLIFDYLSPLKRNIVLRRYQKNMRHAGDM
ncbi:MAG: peptide deformylase [Alphaproteobacteria bacterium]|nr:peptide deformylase [Alphaproteobacteria bacterium]